tara:strand:- start:49449 stop:50270 length:822 start_codon:yes stop_codon:yes gene_type:complete
MDWKESCRARLPEHLDAQGDLAPPWEEFPTYEHLSLGWRMGSGEDWLGLWHVFLDGLAEDKETRLAYLKRHRPAPVCWALSVWLALQPKDDSGDEDAEHDVPLAVLQDLIAQGLVGLDVAYGNWLSKQDALRPPWQYAETPNLAARIHAREFWFSSRQLAGLSDEERKNITVPQEWQSCADALATRAPAPLDLSQGLQSLARMLCAGTVQAPWDVGAKPADFADSFDNDMGYVDAFRLWTMSAFDAQLELDAYLEAHPAPADWSDWVRDELRD